MKRDVLDEICSARMRLDEAEELYDEIMDSDVGGDLAELLGLSSEEWTAFGQGVWFDELAEWRKNGWPHKCVLCGEDIVLKSFGWLVLERDGVSCLRHIECRGG